MNINHDIRVLDIRRKGLSFGQIIGLALAMKFNPIPPHAHDLDPVTVKRIRGRLVRSPDMHPRDHTVGRELVLTRRAGPAHFNRLTGLW